ncbi:MAG TPA: hypothetical protein V6D17_18980 [Candidatus Obscuribacterales bacterium]
MKEEISIVPILLGIALAIVASHLSPENYAGLDAARLVLLFASTLLVFSGMVMFCAVSAHKQDTARVADFDDRWIT